MALEIKEFVGAGNMKTVNEPVNNNTKKKKAVKTTKTKKNGAVKH